MMDGYSVMRGPDNAWSAWVKYAKDQDSSVTHAALVEIKRQYTAAASNHFNVQARDIQVVSKV